MNNESFDGTVKFVVLQMNICLMRCFDYITRDLNDDLIEKYVIAV